MRQIFLKTQLLGSFAGQEHDKKRSVILLNQIVLVFLFLQGFLYFEFLFPLQYDVLIIIFIIQLLTGIPLILAYFNHTNAAKWYFNVVFLLLMTAIICTHGWALRADYSYLVFAVTAIFLFKKISHKIFLIALIIGCYFFTVYYTNNYPPTFAENVSSWNSSILFLAMIFSIILIINGFVTDNQSYQDKLTKALEDLQKEQAKIEIQNKTLESINKDLERFAYISSHNLKTPVRTIRSFADLISRDLKKGKHENLEEYLDFIKQGASQMQLLITDILEYSQFNQQETFETTQVNLNQTIDFIHFQLQSFTDKPIHIKVSELPIIQSNRTFINAIFQNLIENGVKYNESERFEITVSYEDKGDKHLFIFKDNGIGIDAAYHDKIFEMFERLQTDSKYDGSGVGLGMSKKIIEKLNGRIWVDSNIGQGSTFYVELPKVYL
jgi:signal transduction histidine kinase